jgi:hypothetical protein
LSSARKIRKKKEKEEKEFSHVSLFNLLSIKTSLLSRASHVLLPIELVADKISSQKKRGEKIISKERDTEEEEEKRNLFVVFGLRFACEDLLTQREMTKKKIELKKSKSHYTHFLSPS